MGMEAEAQLEGFTEEMLKHYPKATLGEDADGQLIIYTNLMQDGYGHIVELLEK